MLYDYRGMRATGRTGDRFVELVGEDLIKLPKGASLVMLPGGAPVGISRAGRFSLLESNHWVEGRTWAVGALLPQGYTRILLPSFIRVEKDRPLPLLGYAAVADRGGELYVAARRTGDPYRWDPVHYNTKKLPALIKERLVRFPQNRILNHLARCSMDYQCFTAQNIFYNRWEGGIPVSPLCNARCLGCISLQPAECCPSPQSRITFTPSPEEVSEVAVPHLELGEKAIISFGQGCEGEPLLASETIIRSIELIRSQTDRGTINMNSNGGRTVAVEEICRAGLDAIRVSLISACPDTYDAYCRPCDFGLDDVRRSIRTAVNYGVYTSLNLLVFPGLTDRAEELESLLELVRETGLNMVQLRNLNIDPDWLFQYIPAKSDNVIGIPALIKALGEVPGLVVGSFSRPVKHGRSKN